MNRKMGYRWLLREQMAEHGLWKTTELAPLLAERSIQLSSAQIYRLVTHTPERLSLDVLAALCDILDCDPNDLIAIETTATPNAATATGENLGDVTELRASSRPRRARVHRPDDR